MAEIKEFIEKRQAVTFVDLFAGAGGISEGFMQPGACKTDSKMRYYQDSHITSLDEVKDFFIYLHRDLNVAFHPDEDFKSYISHETGERSFTDSECETLNRLMDEAFVVCVKSGDEEDTSLSIFRESVVDNYNLLFEDKERKIEYEKRRHTVAF